MKESSRYLLIALITFLSGYIFLRLAYLKTTNIPFVQEIVLIILGTIATIAITAALLNKQSEVELDKEQRVKLFELKSSLYFELIELIEKVIGKKEINQDDLLTLEFLTHKISTIASSEVLEEYSNFIEAFKRTSFDSKITPLESDELSSGLAKLCGKIRYDLLSNENRGNAKIQKIIESNIDKI